MCIICVGTGVVRCLYSCIVYYGPWIGQLAMQNLASVSSLQAMYVLIPQHLHPPPHSLHHSLPHSLPHTPPRFDRTLNKNEYVEAGEAKSGEPDNQL